MTSNKSIQSKTLWRRFLVVPMIVAVLCSGAACKKSKAPSKKEIYNKIKSESVTNQIYQTSSAFTYKELCDSWGKPDVERTAETTKASYRAWKYNDGYIYAILDSEAENSVYAFGVSVKHQMTYVSRDDDTFYFQLLYPGETSGNCEVAFGAERFASGEMDGVKEGELFDIDYDGMVLQSYPAIIDVFFSVTSSDEALRKAAESTRDRL